MYWPQKLELHRSSVNYWPMRAKWVRHWWQLT